MNIELPKDAEGREIPLDTKVLYDKDGNAKEVQRYDFSVCQSIPSLKWEAVMFDSTVHWVSNLYITPPTPPDSWKKLEEDLCIVEDFKDTPYLDGPACAYVHNIGKSCGECKFYGGTSCVGKMCADIASRIRKLRGED